MPPNRLAGVLMVTDGVVHDLPASAAELGFRAPLHALITGRPNERDRRVALREAPRFGIVGRDQTIRAEIEERGGTGTARVTVSRMKASVPGCPDFTRNSSVDYDQNTSSNFGCGTNASLAAMVAQPEDLVHGHGTTGGSDPSRITKAIEAFRKAVPTGSGGTAVAGAGTGGGH